MSLSSGVSLALMWAAAPATQAAADAPPGGPQAPSAVTGPAVPDSLDLPLAGTQPGDVARGRAIVADRRVGLCLLCHSGPFPDRALQGTLAPDLAGAGARWTTGQLRLRVADARRLNPAGLMPSYLRTEGLGRVGAAWQGQPLLQAQQVEDVVAYLATLR